MNRGYKVRPKRNRANRLGCHDRHPLPRVCLREPGSRDVITDNGATSSVLKWYVTTIIDIYMTSPSVCLWKTVHRRQDYLTRQQIKFRTQYSTKTGPQTDDVWRMLWRHCEHEAIATGFSRRPKATPGKRWIWHASKMYGITAFMLNGLYRNVPVFLEENFLILEHKVSFRIVPYPSSVLICKNRQLGSQPLTARLSCQWSVAQQRGSPPASPYPN